MERSEGVPVPLRQPDPDELRSSGPARPAGAPGTRTGTRTGVRGLAGAVLPPDGERDRAIPAPVRERIARLVELARRHGGELDDEDEAVLMVLAAAAGMAVEDARLFGGPAHRERWLRANAEITCGLLSGGSRSEVLGLIAERAREIGSAALAALAVPVPDGEALTVELAIGDQAQAHRGLVLPVEGTLTGAAFSTGAPVTSADVRHDARAAAGPPRFAGLGPAVATPIGSGQSVRGVVLLARAAGRPAFTEEETELLAGFAGQAAVAMELDERRRDAEQVLLLRERDRIARDLHDLAIQRLFATGMTLQSAGRFITHPEACERVLRAVDDLDETIKIIRSTIFGLRTHEDTGGSRLRARVVHEAGEAGQALGFAPGLRMEGLLDTEVPREIADHAVAVLSEALSNTARHAHATRVEVSLRTDGHEVRLTVDDNGIGSHPGTHRGGLRNLTERAQHLGGALEITRAPSGGTSLSWHVPVGAGGDGAGAR